NEYAGIARVRGIEASLDVAHQLEQRSRRQGSPGLYGLAHLERRVEHHHACRARKMLGEPPQRVWLELDTAHAERGATDERPAAGVRRAQHSRDLARPPRDAHDHTARRALAGSLPCP